VLNLKVNRIISKIKVLVQAVSMQNNSSLALKLWDLLKKEDKSRLSHE